MLKLGLAGLKKLRLGVAILLIQMFMYVNAPFFFGDQSDFFQKVITVYFVMLLSIFAIPDTRLKLLNYRLTRFKKFLIWFFGTVFVVSIGGSFFGGSLYPEFIGISGVAWSMILFHALIVAFIEEFFFREFLLKRIGLLWSSVAFGLFHFVAYGYVWGSIFIATFLGLLLGIIKLKFSPNDNLANIGSHAGWNVVQLGFLSVLGAVS
jgi:membrane protease YdiL (CAAX protease family)